MKFRNMNTKTLIYSAFFMLSLAATSAQAALVLTVDLSVENQISILATDGVSAITTSGSDTTGIYLENFFGSDPGSGNLSDVNVGTLTNALNPSDGTPSAWNSNSNDNGLNVWSFSSDNTVEFIAGQLAFVGSATWDVTAEAYQAALSGQSSGNVYFPADTNDDIQGLSAIGTWGVTRAQVPTPPMFALFGIALAGLLVSSRKRAK